MYVSKTSGRTVACTAFALMLAASLSWAQGQQVLSEVGTMGAIASGEQGIVRPDFSDSEPGDYRDWVALMAGRDFRSFALSSRGTALVLDGTVIREFTRAGAEKTTAGFPMPCTESSFAVTRPNGQPSTDSLSSCSAFTPLNDGTLRIAGQIKGGGFVIIAYDPKNGDTALKASGTPPSIVDMDGDEFADSNTRKNAGYWAVGDRKKVIFFPLDPATTEQNFEVVATLNGVSLDGVTPFGEGRVVVALNTGELQAVDTASGASASFASLPTGAACNLGNKDPQRFSVRGDPSGILFAGNRGCHEIRVFDGNLTEMGASEAFTGSPFKLQNPESFHVEALDWQIGLGGDFIDCQGVLMSEGCEFGAKHDQAVMWNTSNIGGTDTSFRMFEFVDLVDCRWSGDRPCPILNCPAADTGGDESSCVPKEEQVLDLAQVLIRADPSGTFQDVAFSGPTPPEMPIPAYMRGEECFPNVLDANECLDNGYRFHSFFAVTDAVFTGKFFTDYQLDEFRDGTSKDPCVIPMPESGIPEINETANLIVYNTDSFGTVDRGGVEGQKGGVIINDACNGQAGGFRWSSQTVGLELYDETPEAYIHQADRMMLELQDAKDQLLCSAFEDPQANLLGPLLLGADCSRIQSELDQMVQKKDTCFSSLYGPQTGNSAENCNAFFTKVQNLEGVLDASAWPDPALASNLDMLRPNYEGEFRARLATLAFFVKSYVLNGVPPGGIATN